jgi:hypothetical protein
MQMQGLGLPAHLQALLRFASSDTKIQLNKKWRIFSPLSNRNKPVFDTGRRSAKSQPQKCS